MGNDVAVFDLDEEFPHDEEDLDEELPDAESCYKMRRTLAFNFWFHEHIKKLHNLPTLALT